MAGEQVVLPKLLELRFARQAQAMSRAAAATCDQLESLGKLFRAVNAEAGLATSPEATTARTRLTDHFKAETYETAFERCNEMDRSRNGFNGDPDYADEQGGGYVAAHKTAWASVGANIRKAQDEGYYQGRSTAESLPSVTAAYQGYATESKRLRADFLAQHQNEDLLALTGDDGFSVENMKAMATLIDENLKAAETADSASAETEKWKAYKKQLDDANNVLALNQDDTNKKFSAHLAAAVAEANQLDDDIVAAAKQSMARAATNARTSLVNPKGARQDDLSLEIGGGANDKGVALNRFSRPICKGSWQHVHYGPNSIKFTIPGGPLARLVNRVFGLAPHESMAKAQHIMAAADKNGWRVINLQGMDKQTAYYVAKMQQKRQLADPNYPKRDVYFKQRDDKSLFARMTNWTQSKHETQLLFDKETEEVDDTIGNKRHFDNTFNVSPDMPVLLTLATMGRSTVDDQFEREYAKMDVKERNLTFEQLNKGYAGLAGTQPQPVLDEDMTLTDDLVQKITDKFEATAPEEYDDAQEKAAKVERRAELAKEIKAYRDSSPENANAFPDIKKADVEQAIDAAAKAAPKPSAPARR